MGGTVKEMGDRRSSSDDDNGYKIRGAAVVSSTVSEELIALNIVSSFGKSIFAWRMELKANLRVKLQKNDVVAGSVVKKTNSVDDDILSVCVNEEDTKFVDDILIAERKIEKPVRSGKRR